MAKQVPIDERLAFLVDREPSEVARITQALLDWAHTDVGPYYEAKQAAMRTAAGAK